jgi:hypothetical protein
MGPIRVGPNVLEGEAPYNDYAGLCVILTEGILYRRGKSRTLLCTVEQPINPDCR